MNRIPKLAGLAEIAGLAGVSRQRAHQLTQHKDFPKPVQVLAMGPVWCEDDVRAFLATPRPAGRQAAAARKDLRMASVYKLTGDDERFGMSAGDVLLCVPYGLDPGKLSVICRVTDGYNPECNVYKTQVTRMNDDALCIWAYDRLQVAR